MPMSNSLLSKAVGLLKDIHPVLATPIGEFMDGPGGESYVSQAEWILELLQRKVGGNSDAFQRAMDAYGQVCFDFIRMQRTFEQRGEYHNRHYETMCQQVYQDAETMAGYYLDGLLMTFAFWPNHQAIYLFFRNCFLPRLQKPKKLLEVGVGHGLFSLSALEHCPALELRGLDISEFSLQYTRELLQKSSIPDRRYQLQQGDILDGAPEWMAGVDAAVCGEVLEHVPHPEKVLSAIRRSVKPHAFVFLTTCANAEAVDHFYLFHSADHIRSFLYEQAFAILDELVLAVPGLEGAPRIPINYACIGRFS
ncbi:class I SAM-dependent methyltransferase [Planctomycetota bacterium]